MSILRLFAVFIGTLILPQSSGYLIKPWIQYKHHCPLPDDRYSIFDIHGISSHRQRREPLRAISSNRIKTEAIQTDDVIIIDKQHNRIDQFPETSEEVISTINEHGVISDELDKRTGNECNEHSNVGEGSRNRYDYVNSTKRATLKKTVILHHAGITGRSSLAKTQNDRRRIGGEKDRVGAVGWMLGKVRMAAGASALVNRRNDDSHKWKNAIQSTVAVMLSSQDTLIQQQIGAELPPPGTKSMGLLGDIIQDPLPDIIPRPGTYLVGTGSRDESRLTIRSSIPHSTDDTHIADLRLSVFSQFDKEQQCIFRNRSLEVLNIRRRKGAVVLVAEEETQTVNTIDHHYLNEIQSRIERGHVYGARKSNQYVATSFLDSTALTVRPGRGVTVTSVSSGVAVVDDTEFTATIGDGIIIGSVECSHQEFKGTMLGNLRPPGSLMYVTEVAVRSNARRCGVGVMLMRGVDEVTVLRNVETIYLHVDVTNRAACSMYEKCGYHYLDKRLPMYAQFTASLNLHDGATHGRSHFLMCKNLVDRATWLDNDESNWSAQINEFCDAV